MAPHTAGTLVLDGLIEGSVASLAPHENRLRKWVAAARQRNLRFHLQIDGNTFSLLADSEPVAVSDLEESADRVVADLVGELLTIFPLDERGAIFSTLRSREFRAGEEVQTLYAVGPDGNCHTRQRVVDADTAAPEVPMTREQRIRILLAAGVLAVLVIGALLYFLPVDEWLKGAGRQITPYDSEALEVEADTFEGYFEITGRKTGGGSRYVELTLKRGGDFPTDAAAAEALLEREDLGPVDRLIAEAIVRGYVRVERYDEEGKLIGHSMERVAGLRDAEEIKLRVAVDSKQKLTRARITY